MTSPSSGAFTPSKTLLTKTGHSAQNPRSMSVIAILQQLTTKAPVLAVREAVRRGGFSERAGCVTGNWRQDI